MHAKVLPLALGLLPLLLPLAVKSAPVLPKAAGEELRAKQAAEQDGAMSEPVPPEAAGSQPLAEQAAEPDGAVSAPMLDPWQSSDDGKRNAISVAAGMFHRGWYSVWDTENDEFVTCNAWTLCGEELFGGVVSVDYTRRLRHSGNLSLDLDVSASLAYQNIEESWYQPIPPAEQESTFGMLAVVPTLRWRLPKPLRPFTLGIGAGFNLAIVDVPYEYPYDIPFLMAVNIELAYQHKPTAGYELFAALRHRCAAYGLFNTTDDARPGSQYYLLGFRAWL